MTTRWATTVTVLRTLATHRSTYRFLALILVSLGAIKAGPLVEALGDGICVLMSPCEG